MIKFITSFREEEPTNSWIKELAKHLDVEFASEDNILQSNRPCLIWNPVAKVVSSKFIWKDKLYKALKAKEKIIYSVERGYLPNCLYIDKYGVLANSESYQKKNWDNRLTYDQRKLVNVYISEFTKTNTTLEEQGSRRISKKRFYKKLELKDNEIKVFIPLQKANDSVIRLWSDWIRGIPNFKKLIKDLASENPNIKFLVKAHPRRLKDKISSYKNIVNVDNLHYKDCIAYSDIILTINSGVGLQAMMWEKSVITIGKAFYHFDCINYKANNKQEIVKYIKERKKPDMEKVKKFIYFLKYNFYTDCEMKDLQPTKINRIVFEHPTRKQNIIIIPK